MRRRMFGTMTAFAAMIALALGLVAGGVTVSAQDAATPESDMGTAEADGEMMDGHLHPVHIHSGTCESLGDVVFPLNDLTDADAEVGDIDTDFDELTGSPADASESDGDVADDASGTPMDEAADSEMEDAGTPDADEDMMADSSMDEVVARSTTTVSVTMEDVLGSEHAINVHESAENISNYIACGNLSGEASDDGGLEIELDELNESGFMGVARLVDNGDGTIEVTVELMHTESDGAMAADDPESTPEA